MPTEPTGHLHPNSAVRDASAPCSGPERSTNQGRARYVNMTRTNQLTCGWRDPLGRQVSTLRGQRKSSVASHLYVPFSATADSFVAEI